MLDSTKRGSWPRPGNDGQEDSWRARNSERKKVARNAVRHSDDVPARNSHGKDSNLAANQCQKKRHLTPEFSGGRAAAVI